MKKAMINHLKAAEREQLAETVSDARMEKIKLFEGKHVSLRVGTFSLYRD